MARAAAAGAQLYKTTTIDDPSLLRPPTKQTSCSEAVRAGCLSFFYQPRVASFSCSRRLPTLMPTMASPRSSEISARILGLL